MLTIHVAPSVANITDSIRELELSSAEMILQLYDFNNVDNRRGVAHCEEQLAWIGHAIEYLQRQLNKGE